jgi:hypothetical protein
MLESSHHLCLPRCLGKEELAPACTDPGRPWLLIGDGSPAGREPLPDHFRGVNFLITSIDKSSIEEPRLLSGSKQFAALLASTFNDAAGPALWPNAATTLLLEAIDRAALQWN